MIGDGTLGLPSTAMLMCLNCATNALFVCQVLMESCLVYDHCYFIKNQ